MELDQKTYFNEYYKELEDPDMSKYLPLWEVIVRELRMLNARKVLDIGCGSGYLGTMMKTSGIDYVGFDFSREAVKFCQNKNLNVFLGNAEDLDVIINSDKYTNDWDSFVCTEVLEHIEDDISVVKQLPLYKPIFISVPDFGHKSHVRHFKSEKDVEKRYGEYFTSLVIEKIGKRYLLRGWKCLTL